MTKKTAKRIFRKISPREGQRLAELRKSTPMEVGVSLQIVCLGKRLPSRQDFCGLLLHDRVPDVGGELHGLTIGPGSYLPLWCQQASVQ